MHASEISALQERPNVYIPQQVLRVGEGWTARGYLALPRRESKDDVLAYENKYLYLPYIKHGLSVKLYVGIDRDPISTFSRRPWTLTLSTAQTMGQKRPVWVAIDTPAVY